MEEKLSKKGELLKTKEGDLLLVNEKGNAYIVEESIVVIWNSFQDKTVEEVIEEIAVMINRDKEEIREPIKEIVNYLKEAELLA